MLREVFTGDEKGPDIVERRKVNGASFSMEDNPAGVSRASDYIVMIRDEMVRDSLWCRDKKHCL